MVELKEIIESLYSYEDYKKLAKSKNIKLPKSGYEWLN